MSSRRAVRSSQSANREPADHELRTTNYEPRTPPMVFNFILALLLAGIVYIHWLQGLFSSVISMAIAIAAAAMAMAYHESIIVNLLGGKMADYAHGMLLPTLFAVFYIVPRIAFDLLVPGNVRVPHLADKIGGGVCGLIAGIFTLGIVAIGAQMLPLGPDIAFFSRHELRSLEVTAPGPRCIDIDASLDNVLVNDAEKLTANAESGVWFGFDNRLVDFVSMQSDRGAMMTDRKFAAIHPNLPAALFNQRLGPPLGAKRTYTTFVNGPAAAVKGTPRFLKRLRSIDAMPGTQRGKDGYPFDAQGIASEGGTWLIAVPIAFTDEAADKDKIVRISPGQIRLVSGRGKEYYPIGTLYRGNVLFRERRDDIIHIDMSKAPAQNERGLPVFVFQVEAPGMLTFDAKEGNPNGFEKGTFIELKRMNYAPLGGVKIAGPDAQFFPKGDGFGTKVPPQPKDRSSGTSDPTNPVLRRFKVIAELEKEDLDKSPDPSSVPDESATPE